MKLLRNLPMALGAIALLPASAHALTPAKGDVLLGFRVNGTTGSGVTTSYVLDLGPAAALRDATGPLSFGNISDDLVLNYGSGWQARTDLLWTVIAAPDNTATVAGDLAATLYLGKPQTQEGVAGTAFNMPSFSQRQTVAANFANAFGVGGVGGYANTPAGATNPDARIESNGDLNAWRGFLGPGGIAGQAGSSGNSDFGAPAEMEGKASQTISLFRYATTDENAQTVAAGVFLGTVKVDGSGNVTFTPATAALTYSTWAATNAGGQAATLDYDKDGISNGVEFFTGTAGNAFTVAPAVSAGQISWPRASGRTVTSVFVQTSTDLTNWTNVGSNQASGTGPVTYTLPTGQSKIFVRLAVAP